MHARTMPWQDVRPSVRLSHAGIGSKRLHNPQSCFRHRVGPPLTGWQYFYSDPPPLTGALNTKGYEKVTIFDQYLAFISQMMQDRTIVTIWNWKANRKPRPSFRMVPGYRFEWPWGHAYSTSNNLKMVQHTTIYLQWSTNRKSYIMIYQTAPFSMTLNDPYLHFQGHAILWR